MELETYLAQLAVDNPWAAAARAWLAWWAR